MYRFSLPPSANRYWRIYNGRVVVSEAANEYKHLVKMLARCSSPPVTILTGPVRVQVAVYRARKSGDLDNFLKILLDALQGVFYVNDSQVVEINASLHDDRHEPRVEVAVQTALWESVCTPDAFEEANA